MKQIQYIVSKDNSIVKNGTLELEDNNIQIGDYPYYLIKYSNDNEVYYEFKYLDSSDFIELNINNTIIGLGENTGRIYYVKKFDRIQTNGKDKWHVLINNISRDERFIRYLPSLKEFIKIISQAEKSDKAFQ